MRLIENIEKFIRVRKPHFTTSSDTDKRILDDSFTEMEATQAQSVGAGPNVWAVVARSRATRLAAAGMIVAALVLVFAIPEQQTETNETVKTAKSPAEMLTFMSLTIAYRRGGIEAVEQQCEKAFEMLGPRPAALSTQDILKELNGS